MGISFGKILCIPPVEFYILEQSIISSSEGVLKQPCVLEITFTVYTLHYIYILKKQKQKKQL